MTELSGAELRDRGVTDALAADMAVHRGLADEIQAVLDRLIASGQIFDADTLRSELPETLRAVLPTNLMPGLFRAAVARGQIRCVGYKVSERRSRHAGVLRVWVRSDVDLEAAA